MAIGDKVTNANHTTGLTSKDKVSPVYAKQLNDLKDELTDGTSTDLSVATISADTISETTAGSGVTIDSLQILDGGIQLSTGVYQKTAEVTISAAEIVGTSAGDLGHADGVELVAAPGAGYALQFVSAVVIYDYDTAAYTGGAGDDLTVYINSVAVSGAIATADLITKAGDTVIGLNELTTDKVLGVNSNINLACTAVTQPGTAAGVIRVKTTYNVITTGL
jgi:hypothetical protein